MTNLSKYFMIRFSAMGRKSFRQVMDELFSTGGGDEMWG